MNSKIITLDQLTKNFTDRMSKRTYQVIRGIDLDIMKNSFNSLIGPSGVGKSTLLKLMGGMINPTTGSITIDNTIINQLNKKQLIQFRQSTIGVLWQSPSDNLLPNLSAKKNILLAMQIANLPRELQKKRVSELLSQVGMSHREEHKLHQLSGGEAQRISLASALANNPKILLADEPTGELDLKSKYEVLEYLNLVKDELGITIILVTHDLEIANHADYTFNMIDGTIAEVQMGKYFKEGVFSESISVVNQFGMVKIPTELHKELLNARFVKFVKEQDGRIYIKAVHTDIDGDDK